MHRSSDDTAGSRYLRFEVAPDEQGIAYTPGDGTVVWINDKVDNSTFGGLSPVQRAVAAARFRTIAALLDGIE